MNTGWREEPLGNLVSYLRGLTYSKSDEVEFSNNIVLRANNVDLATNMLDFAELKYIKDSFTIPVGKKVRKDSIIICTASGSKSHLGKVAYIDEDYDHAFGGFMGMIIPGNKILPKYLFHLMTSGLYKEFIAGLSDGVNINNLKFDDLAQFSVPYPSKEEQQRIVAILDEAFAAIATAKANAEKNLQNARAFFQGYLNDVFTQRGDRWVERTIGDICLFRGGGTPSKAVERYWNGRIPWVSPKDMKYEVISDSIDHISPEAIEASATSLVPQGAVLMVVRSGILARIVPLAISGRELTINQDLKALCPKNGVESKFLYSLLDSKMSELLSLVSRGATVHRLKTDQIRSLKCFLPPKDEQNRIVELIESMRAEIGSLATIYIRKLVALEALKKSILHDAFSGQLTAKATDHNLAEAAL